jgi:arylsulfatase A-like enzyme
MATVDFFPTAVALAGVTDAAAATRLPLDGKNALHFLLGEDKSTPENLYLYFDKEFLQTGRSGRWKIHVARWNIPRYTAASRQQKNVTLRIPELYDMSLDEGESYDVAARNPEVVRALQSRIAEALRTFPEEIQKANADLMKSSQ